MLRSLARSACQMSMLGVLRANHLCQVLPRCPVRSHPPLLRRSQTHYSVVNSHQRQLRQVHAKAGTDIGDTASPAEANPASTPAASPLHRVLEFATKHPLAAAVVALGTAALVGLMAAPALAVSSSVSLGDIIMDRAVWALGKISQLNIITKIVLVFASTLPAVVAFGALYSAITSTEWKAAFLKMYVLLNKLPGMQVLGEKSLPASVLVNLAFISGTFIFAVLLGIVTEEVKTTFKNFRNGKYMLNESGHVVVLNWNQQTVPLLRQIAQAREAGERGIFSQPVAVLANVPKATMDSAIASKLKGWDVDVVTRQGSPVVPADLQSVAAAQAAAIIVMIPDEDNSRSAADQVAQTAVSLTAACPSLARQHLVFQASHDNGGVAENMAAFKRLAHLTGKAQVLDYSDSELVQRMTAVSAIQPQMSRIISKLVGLGWMRIHSMPLDLVGTTYQHSRRMFADGVLVGLIKEGVPDLLVKETYKLQERDQLVMIVTSPDPVPLNSAAEPIFLQAAEKVKARVATASSYKHMSRQIVCVLGEPDASTVSELVDIFSELCPKGSTVTFISESGACGPARKGNCGFRYLGGGQDSRPIAALLKDAGIEEATAVMVGATQNMPTDAADAFVTTTLLQVQDGVLSSKRKGAPHFVAHIRKAVTEKSISSFLGLMKQEAKTAGRPVDTIIAKPDLFHSDEFCGGVLVHTAKTPAFSQLVADVLQSDGAEVYIRNPLSYNLRLGDLLTFADIAETSRAFNETAIGVIAADGSLVLAPEPTYPVNLQENDRIVVFAEDYNITKSKSA